MKHKTGKNIQCTQCSQLFYIPLNRFETAKYCSRSCKWKGEASNHNINCEICGKNFTVIHTRKDIAKYCSRSCYYKAQHLKGSIKVFCKHCNNSFRKSPSTNRVFCSVKCRSSYQLLSFSQNRSTLRVQFIRRNLLIECNDCSWNKYPKLLGIHHQDHNNKNNTFDNLIVLCPNCHSIRHMKHVVHSRAAAL